ncbi:tripartite tricarboxylate transporter TctB family protein [Salinicola sp. JS01]|uniref:tripartite tricarboxylate transporter TctB family protein n=1 Tax=Salinicola sp. JS01 TaxID=3050071 RepID=UPI00255BFCFB|nr:tripartite tricarboxylate transporter TctB family protein [Salinicola sp. JS01]WIX31854.1 tripartite tricarboxylate transporter TctB family protein [Salinicola sp. JS01]
MLKSFSENRLISVVLMVSSGGLLVSSLASPSAPIDLAFNPQFFPRIVLGVLFALALLDLGMSFAKRQERTALAWRRTLPVVLALPLYVLLIPVLGYFISSTLMGMLILAVMRAGLVATLVMPTVAAGALVLLFNHLLSMPLPTSPFTWWF